MMYQLVNEFNLCKNILFIMNDEEGRSNQEEQILLE